MQQSRTRYIYIYITGRLNSAPSSRKGVHTTCTNLAPSFNKKVIDITRRAHKLPVTAAALHSENASPGRRGYYGQRVALNRILSPGVIRQNTPPRSNPLADFLRHNEEKSANAKRMRAWKYLVDEIFPKPSVSWVMGEYIPLWSGEARPAKTHARMGEGGGVYLACHVVERRLV